MAAAAAKCSLARNGAAYHAARRCMREMAIIGAWRHQRHENGGNYENKSKAAGGIAVGGIVTRRLLACRAAASAAAAGNAQKRRKIMRQKSEKISWRGGNLATAAA